MIQFDADERTHYKPLFLLLKYSFLELVGKWRKMNTYTIGISIKVVQSLWEIIWRFLKIVKMEASYDLAIPFLGTCSKKCGQYIEQTSLFQHYSQ